MIQAVLTGALEHLMRYPLTGCARSAFAAARLLGQIADQHDIDRQTRTLCARMSEALEASGVKHG